MRSLERYGDQRPEPHQVDAEPVDHRIENRQEDQDHRRPLERPAEQEDEHEDEASMTTGGSGSASSVSVIQFGGASRANTAPNTLEVTASRRTMLPVAALFSARLKIRPR